MNQTLDNQLKNAMGRSLPADRLQQFMDAFGQKFAATSAQSKVNDEIVGIYARHFSADDIKALTQFYESPLGKRMLTAFPLVAQESQLTGQRVMTENAMGILRGMTTDYPELKQILPPEQAAPAAPQQPATPAPHLGSSSPNSSPSNSNPSPK